MPPRAKSKGKARPKAGAAAGASTRASAASASSSHKSLSSAGAAIVGRSASPPATSSSPSSAALPQCFGARAERLLRNCLGQNPARVDLNILTIALSNALLLPDVDASLVARCRELQVEAQAAQNGGGEDSEEEVEEERRESPQALAARLFAAVEDGKLAVVQACLDAGEGTPEQVPVDIADDDGNTPLSDAACYGELEIAKELLSRGAHPDVRNSLGRTPLWRACYNGHLELVTLLLEHGADKSIPASGGEEPGLYGTAETKAAIAAWDPEETTRKRRELGLDGRVAEARSLEIVSGSNGASGRPANFNEFAQNFDLQKLAAPADIPEWPIKIGLRELATSISVAHLFGRVPLVLCGQASMVETFFMYTAEAVIDAKQILGDMFVQKSKTLGMVQGELHDKLLASMETHGYGLSLQIRMGNTACDFKGKLCRQGAFPAEVFGGPAKFNNDAAARNFGKLTVIQPEFLVIVTSTFTVPEAMEHLPSALPFFEDMAIIEVDDAA